MKYSTNIYLFHESNKYITFYIRVTLLQLNKKKN